MKKLKRKKPIEPPRPRKGRVTAQKSVALITRTELEAKIEDARRSGLLPALFWAVEVRLPIDEDTPAPLVAVASHPFGLVPVIPVGADAEVSRAFAVLLMATFHAYNWATGAEFAITLLDGVTAADGVYEWGQSFDMICVECGAVFPHTNYVTLCDDCSAPYFPS